MKYRWFTMILTFCLVTVLVFTSYAMPIGAKKQPDVRYHPEYKTATSIHDNWIDTKPHLLPHQLLWPYLDARKSLFKFIDNPKNHFQLMKTYTDEFSMTHYRLQEIHLGVPVYGSDQTIHINSNGMVTTFIGQVIPNIHLKRFADTKHISSSKAISISKTNIKGARNYLYAPTSTLIIYPHNHKLVYAYQVKIAYQSPQPTVWQYFIDASSGKVIHKINILDKLTGKGTGVKGDEKTFETSKKESLYYLDDRIRNVSTYDVNHQNENSPIMTGELVSSPNNYFTDGSAVDAHAYAEKTFDFYKKTFHRNSFDDKGGPIKSYIHVGTKWNNAAWDGEKMLYGDGDGKLFSPLPGGLDVIAHELTHAVTQNTANLQYQEESGALNESMSDIMAVMVDSDDWLLGEDVFTPKKSGDAIRSMSDPKKYDQPDHYEDRYIGFEDNGGVHINSGINNKAAYLIAAGGTHHGVSIKGIGRLKTSSIYYRALTLYLTSSSDFSMMKDAAILAATDLYGANSKEVATVQQAYQAVGIETDSNE
jgi:Zn-dependent metalloprotease